jgi:NAD(P)-dependent dehydrogenase (short-subunit alcohol dehydrogenase family)
MAVILPDPVRGDENTFSSRRPWPSAPARTSPEDPTSRFRTMSAGIDRSGQVVLITGGTSGLGKVTAERFLTEGADVVVCARKDPDARAIPSAAGRTAAYLPCDVRDPEIIDGLVTQIVERYGRLDIAVNNAGGAPPGKVADVSPRFLSAVVTLNLVAPMYVAQRANAQMQQQDAGGVIVNIASVSGMRPNAGAAAYAAAKAGLINLTASLAVEFAPKVRVVAVTAGALATEELLAQYGDTGFVESVAETVPLGRIGTPEDVVGAISFLTSPDAAFITGSNVVVHGGGDEPPAA